MRFCCKTLMTFEVRQTIEEIINGINNNETAVFCGAGISINSGLPVSKTQKDYILGKLSIEKEDLYGPVEKARIIKIFGPEDISWSGLFENPDRDQLTFKCNTDDLLKEFNANEDVKKAITELWEHAPYGKIQYVLPFEAFWEILDKQHDISKAMQMYKKGEPNKNHILLARLAKENKLKTIITTNFDLLIEKALEAEGIKFNVHYDEKRFHEIDYDSGEVNLIKIHGSIDGVKYGIKDETIRTTIKSVAASILSYGRMNVIQQVFSAGKHKNVLILGYSSSDVFDLSKQIQAISDNRKQVFYVEHSDGTGVESIDKQRKKNPFKEYKNGKRLFINTDALVDNIWDSTVKGAFERKNISVDWKKDIDEWYGESIGRDANAASYNIAGLTLQNVSEYRTALKYLNEALKIAQKNVDNKEEGLTLNHIGDTYSRLSEYPKAIDCFERAIEIAIVLKDNRSKGALLGNIGATYGQIAQYDTAIKYLESSLAVKKAEKDKLEEGTTLNNLGNIYHGLGEYNKAKHYFEQAIKIARFFGNKEGEGTILGNLGTIYSISRAYKKAELHYEQAMEIAKALGNKQGEVKVLTNYGNHYAMLQIYQKAVGCFEQALGIAETIEDKQGEVDALANLGATYGKSREYQKAIKYLDLTLEKMRAIKDKCGEWTALGNLGSAYGNLGEYQKAVEYFEQALSTAVSVLGYYHPYIMEIKERRAIVIEYPAEVKRYEQLLEKAKAFGDKRRESVLLGKLGLIYVSLGQFHKAIKSYEQAIGIAKMLGEKIGEGLTLGNLGVAYTNLGEYQKAKECYEQSLTVAERVMGHNDPNIRIIKENLALAKSKLEKK